MRILVFEYITGGGLLKQPLPETLLQEGLLMRNALLDDLCSITQIELLVLQDERIAINKAKLQKRLKYLTISYEMELQVLLSDQQDHYDTVWLIAPETGGILAFWCDFFSQQGKILATSAQQVVAICEDKFRTHTLLENAAIPCVPSRLIKLSAVKSYTNKNIFYTPFNNDKCILKINNSVGCDQIYLIESKQHWKNILLKLKPSQQYIIQPYITGKVLSLSCLFYQGKAYFICCNEQHMKIDQQQFELLTCTVNVQHEKAGVYQTLCQQIANVFPDLFGYAGIDFIQTSSGDHLILEINPRLTSSYAGIRRALGINVAELVLAMLNHRPPVLNKTKNQSVIVNMNQGNFHAE